MSVDSCPRENMSSQVACPTKAFKCDWLMKNFTSVLFALLYKDF